MKYIEVHKNEYGGIGHQFHNWMVGLILADMSNAKLIHSPFIKRADRWENVLNFNAKLPSKTNFNKVIKLPQIELGNDETYDKAKAERNLKSWLDIIENGEDETLFKVPFDMFPGVLCEKIIQYEDYLKEAYWANKEKYDFGTNKINVGVHIRRGDINKTVNANRWLELKDYTKMINHFRTHNNTGKELIFHIFSEGNKSSFTELAGKDVVLHLNGSDIQEFNKLISTDIIITGLSTFSILGAYLSDAKIYYNKLRNYTRWSGLDRFTDIEVMFKEKLKIK